MQERVQVQNSQPRERLQLRQKHGKSCRVQPAYAQSEYERRVIIARSKAPIDRKCGACLRLLKVPPTRP
jgi:hypothetical protein